MRELEVPFLTRWIMWAAVRWGAVIKPGGLKGWWREAWRVALITLLTVPIVILPAIFIAVSLAAFFLLELVFWIPLKLTEILKKRRHQPAKEVNAPTVGWRLS